MEEEIWKLIPNSKNDLVYISIYNKDKDKYFEYKVQVKNQTREHNKELLLDFIIEKLSQII